MKYEKRIRDLDLSIALMLALTFFSATSHAAPPKGKNSKQNSINQAASNAAGRNYGDMNWKDYTVAEDSPAQKIILQEALLRITREFSEGRPSSDFPNKGVLTNRDVKLLILKFPTNH